MTHDHHPRPSGPHSRLALRLFTILVPQGEREGLLGDLAEDYVGRVEPRVPKWRARLWYWREVLLACGYGMAMRWRERRPRRKREESWVNQLLQDLRYALRMIGMRPGFAAVVVLTLGLGIGANTAIFSVVNNVLLRPLPYADAERLTLVWGRMSATEVTKAPWSGLDVLDFRARADLFQGFSGTFGQNSTLSGDFEAEPVQLGWTTANFFDLLGVTPMLGRFFLESDETNVDFSTLLDPNATPPTTAGVLSYELWQRRFGSDPGVLGQSIQVAGQPMNVIGVAPKGFKLYLPADAAIPGLVDVWSIVPAGLSQGTRDQQWLTVVGRLKAGVTLAQARSQMRGIATEFRAENQFHSNVGMEIDVVPMQSDVVGHARGVLLTLLGAVGFVLLIACANVANLLLVRGQARQREVAIRTALGGGRSRLIRQLLTESAVLAVLGGGLGLLFAVFGIEALLAMRPANLPRVEDVTIDGTVLAFVGGVSVVAALLFGTLPAFQSSKADLSNWLKVHTLGSAAHHRMRNAFVVAEVALSLVLMIGSGLMLRSFVGLASVRPGFEHEGVLTVNVALPFFKYRGPGEATAKHLALAEQLRALPGVDAVGAVTPLPLAGGGQYWFGPYALDEANEEEWSKNEVDYRPSLPAIFEAMGTRIIAGRGFTVDDNRFDARRVVVVDEKMAEEAWPLQDAIGKQVYVMRPDRENGGGWDRFFAEVVGVVEHVRYDDLRADGRPQIYFPHSDWSWTDLTYAIKVSGDLTTLAGPIRQIIRALDSDIPASTVRPLSDYVGDGLGSTRFALIAIAVFAGVALVLSTVGLYGVISYAVRERTQEIGIRVAFGAARKRIVGMVLKQGLSLTIAGVGIGLVGSFFITRVTSSLLFGVTPTDPITFVVISFVLTGVATVACLVPARRATRVDPMVALRME